MIFSKMVLHTIASKASPIKLVFALGIFDF